MGRGDHAGDYAGNGMGDPCGRPPRGHATRTCQEDMCCGDSRPVSPQATLFSEISSCRNHHILLSGRYFSTGCFFDRLFFLINMVACGDAGRAKLATHVLLACPSGGRPQGSPLQSPAWSPAWSPATRNGISLCAGDHKGRPYSRPHGRPHTVFCRCAWRHSVTRRSMSGRWSL